MEEVQAVEKRGTKRDNSSENWNGRNQVEGKMELIGVVLQIRLSLLWWPTLPTVQGRASVSQSAIAQRDEVSADKPSYGATTKITPD